MRAPRLLSILLILQARGRRTAGELARELEVSERTVYRDLADLGAAGVPVVAERGAGGGYSLMEGYRTNLTGLTAEEAGTMLMAGAPAAATELGLGALLAVTRLKLLAAVPPRLRDIASRAEDRFYLDPAGWVHQAPREARLLRPIARAVWDERQLHIVHDRGGGDRADRTIAPLGLVHKTGSWYVVATCDAEPRVYRVDRIREARTTGVPVVRPSGFDLARFWSTWERRYADSLPTLMVRVRLGPTARRYRGAIGPLAPRGTAEEAVGADGWATMALRFDDVDTATAALLALAPEVEVLDPPELAARIAEVAATVVERHR